MMALIVIICSMGRGLLRVNKIYFGEKGGKIFISMVGDWFTAWILGTRDENIHCSIIEKR